MRATITRFVRRCVSGALPLLLMISSPASSGPALAVATCSILGSATALAAAAGSPRQWFDFPGGEAAETLRRFADESGRQVIYLVDAVRDVTTNAVRGEFTARQVLDRMVTGTALEVVEDAATGALLVKRARPAAVSREAAGTAPRATEPVRETRPAPRSAKRTPLAMLGAWIALALTPAYPAEATAATGTVTGRVFVPARGEFVRNAEVRLAGQEAMVFTGDDGSFLLTRVPAGEVTVVVSYTGYQTGTATLTLAAGQRIVQDFNLEAAAQYKEDAIVRLGEYVVSGERAGNAKAIMDQRAAINAKSVLAADNFGDLSKDNLAEFMKYIPGVELDYLDNGSDGNAIRIGGLDPKYASVSLDGNRLSNVGSGEFNQNSRQFEFSQSATIPVSAIESIEVNKTLTPSMDADAPAGAVNLRSKNAFERKGRLFTYRFALSGNSADLSTGRVRDPAQTSHRRITPNAMLDYADVFLGNRLGVQVSLSRSASYTEARSLTHTYDYGTPARGAVITSLAWGMTPGFQDRASASLNADAKLGSNLVLSWRSSYSRQESEVTGRTFSLNASLATIAPTSTDTSLVANATANNTTRLSTGGAYRERISDSLTLGPRLEYKRDHYAVTLGGSLTDSNVDIRSAANGRFSNAHARLTRMSWSATRPDNNSPDWTVSQRAGLPWSDLANFNLADTYANNISTSGDKTAATKQLIGYVDARATLALAVPVTLKVGLKTRSSEFEVAGRGQQWTYVGPANNQRAPSSALIADAVGGFDPGLGNIGAQGWLYPDRKAMYDLFLTNPGYFSPNTVTNYRNLNLTSRNRIEERIDAAYLEGDTRWRALRLLGGLRYEQTTSGASVYDLRTAAAAAAAGYTPNTIDYERYRYRDGVASWREGRYDNLFVSGGAKYDFSRRLTAQFGFCESIMRPNYNNMSGAASIDDVNRIVTVPNPALRPETSVKYLAGLQYYFEPAGSLDVTAYVLDIDRMLERRSIVSAAEAGYEDFPEYASYDFSTFRNGTASVRNRGVDVSYTQQLVFLPGVLRGLSVFGSVSRVTTDGPGWWYVPKAAKGGVGFKLGGLNLQLRSTWNSAIHYQLNANNEHLWTKERVMFDLTATYRLTSRLELTVSGANLLDAPLVRYSNEPGRLKSYHRFGAVWTVGIKGTY